MTMRIRSDRYYVLRTHPGISGFIRVNDWVETIMTGYKARHHRSDVDREYLVTGLGKYKIGDGHLSDFQPVLSEDDALRWLDANPYGGIVAIQHTINPKPARP